MLLPNLIMQKVVIIYDLPNYYGTGKEFLSNIGEALDMAVNVTIVHNIDGNVKSHLIRQNMSDSIIKSKTYEGKVGILVRPLDVKDSTTDNRSDSLEDFGDETREDDL